MPESYNDNLHKYSSPKIYEFAKDLRQTSTVAEQLLWEHIRNKKLSGLKFRRQHPLDNYIADFYCHEKKLAIQLDGGIHNNKEPTAGPNVIDPAPCGRVDQHICPDLA